MASQPEPLVNHQRKFVLRPQNPDERDDRVMCRKFRAATEQGEVVMVIAEEVD